MKKFVINRWPAIVFVLLLPLFAIGTFVDANNSSELISAKVADDNSCVVSISGPTAMPLGDTAKLESSVALSYSSIEKYKVAEARWYKLSDQEDSFFETVRDTVVEGKDLVVTHKAFFRPYKKGTYHFVLAIGTEGLDSIATHTIVVGGENNIVDPPEPPPVEKAVAMYVIVETSTIDPTLKLVRDARSWRKLADQMGIRWTVADPDAASRAWPNVVKIAQKTGLPAVVWVGADGSATAASLTSVADLENGIRAHGGVK
jgi:hypothetical protein